MTRQKIEAELAAGARLIVQDKVDGSVYCAIRHLGQKSKRIRFNQYMYQLDAKDHLKLVERTRIKGFDHCEYIAGPAFYPFCRGLDAANAEVRRLRAGLESLKIRCDCPGGACTCGAWRNARIDAILKGQQ